MTENRENHQHLCWTRTSRTAGNVDLRASARASLAPGERSRRRKWNWHENRRESALLVKHRRARGRVFPAVKYESVENVTFSDYVGHWRTWGCQHAATKLNAPGTLRHSSVWQKSTISEKGWVFFFLCLFLCLFVDTTWNDVLQQETVKQRYLKMIWSIFQMPVLDTCIAQVNQRGSQLLARIFFLFFSSFFWINVFKKRYKQKITSAN